MGLRRVAIGGAGWEFGWGIRTTRLPIAAIHRALELGINWIDTAAVCGGGSPLEEVVAAALKAGADLVRTYSPNAASLRRTMMIHRSLQADSTSPRVRGQSAPARGGDNRSVPDPLGCKRRSRRRLERDGSAAEGRQRFAGSAFRTSMLTNSAELRRLLELPRCSRRTLIRRGDRTEISCPYCRSNGIGVIVYSPMASGLLTGAMTTSGPQNSPTAIGGAATWSLCEPKLSKNLARGRTLARSGREYGRPPGQVAIAWILANPAVTAAIVGATQRRAGRKECRRSRASTHGRRMWKRSKAVTRMNPH